MINHEFVQTGQTALSIAQKLGYISVVETLKVGTTTRNEMLLKDMCCMVIENLKVGQSQNNMEGCLRYFLKLLSSAWLVQLYF